MENKEKKVIKVKKERPKVGKYVINCQNTCEKLVKEAKKDNLVAVLGNRKDGTLVDVLWIKNIDEASSKWSEYEVNIKDEGCHQFKSFPYLKNKI
jgi:hypothetical protein